MCVHHCQHYNTVLHGRNIWEGLPFLLRNGSQKSIFQRSKTHCGYPQGEKVVWKVLFLVYRPTYGTIDLYILVGIVRAVHLQKKINSAEELFNLH